MVKKLQLNPSIRPRFRRKNPQSLEARLRELLAMDRLYVMEDLATLTGYPLQTVRSQVSAIQNKNYTDNPIDIHWKRGDDNIKRFGNPDATKICKIED